MFCHNCGNALADQSPFCESCGSPTGAGRAVVREGPLRSATEQVGKARVGSRIRPNAVIIGALVVIGLLLLWALSNNESPSPATTVRNEAVRNDESTPTETTPQTDSSIPPLQKSFTSMIESFIPAYSNADTEIRKTDVRFQRKHAIASYFSGAGSLQFEGWVGKVTHLTTESDGEASVFVQLRGTDIKIETWSNSFSDSEDHTMIRRSDAQYTSLRDIKEGDDVTVAGSFLEADKDYIREASLTEQGSMAGPVFIVRFSQISKGVRPLEKPQATQPVTPEAQVNGAELSPSVAGGGQTVVVQPDQPHAATCEVVNTGSSGCVLESHSSATDASTGEDWTITILNSSYAPAVFTARIELQDDAGVIVAAASWGDLSVGGYGRYVFTGRLQHDNKLTFARVIAKLEANRK